MHAWRHAIPPCDKCDKELVEPNAMPILYTDGNSNVDAAGGSQASGAHRDDRTYSDKKQKPRKKSVIGRFGRAVVKSFKANDKGCSRPKDVELANEKLRQINRGRSTNCSG